MGRSLGHSANLTSIHAPTLPATSHPFDVPMHKTRNDSLKTSSCTHIHRNIETYSTTPSSTQNVSITFSNDDSLCYQQAYGRQSAIDHIKATADGPEHHTRG